MALSFQDLLFPNSSEPKNLLDSSQRSSYKGSPYRRDEDQNLERDKKYEQLEKLYEMRLETLKGSLKTSFGIIESDNLINTLKNDASTSEYAYGRVKDILERTINNDREAAFDRVCQQYADLKSEYFQASQDNLKASQKYEDRIEELTKKLETINEKFRSERRNKEDYEDKVKDLQKTIDNMRQTHEQALRLREEEIFQLKQQLLEFGQFQAQARKLDSTLTESEEKYQNLQHEYYKLEKEAVTLRNRNKEQDKNISSLNAIIEEMQQIIDGTQEVIKDNEKIQCEQRCEIELLMEKNKQLEANLNALNENEKNIRDEFNRKITEIETRIVDERSDQEKASATLENKYKTKLKQKQDKMFEYKELLNERDLKIEEMEKYIQGLTLENEKEKEAIDQKFFKQKEEYEAKIRQIEESHKKKLAEINLKKEEEIKEMQGKFENLIEKTMRKSQEEANQKILQITEETKRIMHLLQKKEEEIKKDYIKIDHHEKLTKEKTNLIQQLRQEALNKENQYLSEIEFKLKAQKEKLYEDFTIQTSILKNCATDYERQVQQLRAQKMEVDKELDYLKETNHNLKTVIKDLEFDKAKTMENIVDWRNKMEKLREAYEEADSKLLELRRQLTNEVKGHEETIKHLNVAYEELVAKDNYINSLTQEIEQLGSKLSQLQVENKKLECEHQELKIESTNKIKQQELRISSFEGEMRTIREENKRLKEKVIAIAQEYDDKVEKMGLQLTEMSVKLRKEEEKVSALEFDQKVQQKQVADLRSCLNESERQKKELNSDNIKLKRQLTELNLDKEEIQNKTKEKSTSLYIIKKQIASIATSKINALKTELKDLKKFYSDSFKLYLKENELKVQALVSAFNTIHRRQVEEHKHNMENLERILKLESESLMEKNAIKHKQIQKDIVDSYEHKCSEKDRKIRSLEVSNEQNKDQNLRLQKELQSLNSDNNLLKEERNKLSNELNIRNQEIENKERNFESSKQVLIDDIEERVKEVAKLQAEFLKEKNLLEEKHAKEIKDLKAQLETLKQKYGSSLSSQEQKLNALSLKYFEESERLENGFKETIRKLQLALDESQYEKEKLKKEWDILREKNYLLEKKVVDLGRAKSQFEALYYKDSHDCEDSIDRLREGSMRESLKTRELKRSLAENELREQVEEELADDDEEVGYLAQENDQLQRRLAMLEEQVAINNRQLVSQQEKFRNRISQQSTEGKRIPGFVSPALSTTNESPFLEQSRWHNAGTGSTNFASPKYKDYLGQLSTKTPETKTFMPNRNFERHVFSEKETSYSNYDSKGTK